MSAVEATTTASRNRNKLFVPDDIRGLATEAAKCRDPARRKLLRKSARKARREFEASRAVLPRGTVIHRLVVTKLWINGRASEDRDGWTEEVRAHCEKYYDDKKETSAVQAVRIHYQRSSGKYSFQITVDRVLRARKKFMKIKANGPADCLVTEMLQCLPMETQYTRSRTGSRSGS